MYLINCSCFKKRLDVWITDPTPGDEAFVDMACTHPTSKSHLAGEVKRTRLRLAATENKTRKLPGASVEKMEKSKQATYNLLHSITLRQATAGLRTSEPKLFGAVVSTHGEFNNDMVGLQEWLTSKYAARINREGDRDDGCGKFRNRVRADILRAVHVGHAAMILAAGLLMGSGRDRRRPDDADESKSSSPDSDSDAATEEHPSGLHSTDSESDADTEEGFSGILTQDQGDSEQDSDAAHSDHATRQHTNSQSVAHSSENDVSVEALSEEGEPETSHLPDSQLSAIILTQGKGT